MTIKTNHRASIFSSYAAVCVYVFSSTNVKGSTLKNDSKLPLKALSKIIMCYCNEKRCSIPVLTRQQSVGRFTDVRNVLRAFSASITHSDIDFFTNEAHRISTFAK